MPTIVSPMPSSITSTSTASTASANQQPLVLPSQIPSALPISTQQSSSSTVQIPLQPTVPASTNANSNSNSNSNTIVISPNYITQPALMTSNQAVITPLSQSQSQQPVLSQGFNVANVNNIVCPANSYLVSGQCFCLPGYSNISGSCIQSGSAASELITI